MNAIVSVTADWGIGLDGDLVVPNRADMRRFVALTRGHAVVMGRKTLESFPGGPLKGRKNVVITRNPAYAPEGVEVAHSPAEALELVRALEARAEAGEPVEGAAGEAWLLGGASVYAALLDACERVYVTKNACEVPVDAYFPNLDADPAWTVVEREEGGVTEAGVAFEYVIYGRAATGERQ